MITPFQIIIMPVFSDTDSLTSRGYGSIPPNDLDRARAYIKARDLAYSNACSNLLITLQGVRMSHHIRVRNHALEDQETQMDVEGMLQGVEVLSERTVNLYGAAAVEIVVGIPRPQPIVQHRVDIPIVIRPTPRGQPRIILPDVDVDIEEGYTSVIIDARGFRSRPNMSPTILRTDGSDVWGKMDVDPDFAIREGIALFAHTLTEARTYNRAGDNPLILKAVGVAGPSRSDFVLSEKAARLLEAANGRSGMLDAFRVIFIVD
jgi:hypothetical protein